MAAIRARHRDRTDGGGSGESFGARESRVRNDRAVGETAARGAWAIGNKATASATHYREQLPPPARCERALHSHGAMRTLHPDPHNPYPPARTTALSSGMPRAANRT